MRVRRAVSAGRVGRGGRFGRINGGKIVLGRRKAVRAVFGQTLFLRGIRLTQGRFDGVQIRGFDHAVCQVGQGGGGGHFGPCGGGGRGLL